MFSTPRALVLALAVAVGVPSARNGGEALNHYGLVALSDNAVGARLAARFKARGQPVFLVHDVNAGLGQNDIMRFNDKAVLIDADVWSTLIAEGALDKLRAAPLVRVQGRSTSASWAQRAGLVAGDRQRKAFKVGAELLRVLEENFGGAPQGQQLTVIFEQDHLTLLAPAAFLDQLRFSAVRKVAASGRPTMISAAPDSLLFTGEAFTWQAWGADPTDPSGDLTYQLAGEPPPGVAWNAATHTLSGRPTTSGRWRLTATVQNSGGFRDTLSFVLRASANQPPLLAGEPRAVAVAEREWRFDPTPSDRDHPGHALRVKPGVLPPGMFFLSDSVSLRWTPPASLAGTRQEFSLQIEDALGARREFRYAVQVVGKERILLSEGVKIELPWDTLLVGRTYVWKTRAVTTAWEGQGIRLIGVDGTDSTLHAHDSLIVIPRQAGTHRLNFRFTAQGKPLLQSLVLPVREDLPPEFVTELPEWNPYARDARSYRPVAVDPEGEAVTLTAEFAPGGPLSWDGKRLHFQPSGRGTHSARLTARDAGGKTAEQWLLFEAEPARARSRHILESRVHGAFTAWTYTRDFGTGRIGLYSPNLEYGVVPSSSHWAARETPFFFIGGNLMGDDPLRPERVLWADIGFAFRNPAPRVYAGGLYTRLNGEWHFPGSALSWIEMELTGHVHHALAATDSGTFATMLLDPTDIIARDTLSEKGTLSNIIRDGFRKDNVRFHTRIEALGPLGGGFYLGPAMWRDDVVIARDHDQRFGGALRYRAASRAHLFQLSLRAGWGPGGDGWGAYGSMRLSLGTD